MSYAGFSAHPAGRAHLARSLAQLKHLARLGRTEEWHELLDPAALRVDDIRAIVAGTLGAGWLGHDPIDGPVLPYASISEDA